MHSFFQKSFLLLIKLVVTDPTRVSFMVSTKPVKGTIYRWADTQDSVSPPCHETWLCTSAWQPGISEPWEFGWIKQLYFSFKKANLKKLQKCHM